MKYNILIREYRDSDYAACRALWVEMAEYHADIYEDTSIARDRTGSGFDEYMGRVERCGTWVAEVDGQVAGVAGLLWSREMLEGEIEPVIVTSYLRNNGIGSKLLRYVVAEAKKRKMHFLRIRPVARNARAISLYVRLGFELLGYVDLFQNLMPERGRKWKSGIEVLGHKLKY
jgi:ribosomal protein S18 acetylase RimI-like enzyme